jgi:hypothetical protein
MKKTKEELAEEYIEDKDWNEYFVPYYPHNCNSGYIDGNPIATGAFLAGYEAGQPKWISVEDMTEENCTWKFGDFIALRRNNDLPICAQVIEGEQYGDGTCGISLIDSNENDLYIEDYTHWMPIPTLLTKEK